MKKYKVSVIVPFYNIAGFVGRCIESLMAQTLKEVEFIIVDDASTDGSLEVVNRIVAGYPDRKEDICILSHVHNLGLPAARNTGLAHATGEYIFHCDGDDWVETDMLEKLYRSAESADADFVWCDWLLSFEENERYMPQPDYHTGKEAVEGMLRGTMKYNVWNKLCKRCLYDGLLFPSGRSMGEDMTMIKIASKAKITGHVADALYHYRRTNAEALTQNYSSQKLEELKENTLDTVSFLTHYSEVLDVDIKRFLLNVKLPFLFTGKTEDIKRWRKWFWDADCEILGNKYQSLRVRLLQWCASKGLTSINMLYYHLVQSVIYGKIYR